MTLFTTDGLTTDDCRLSTVDYLAAATATRDDCCEAWAAT